MQSYFFFVTVTMQYDTIDISPTMTTISKSWIQFALSDLDAAKRLFQSPRPTRWTYLLVLWHCHQATEKTLKAVLLEKGKDLLKIHDLPRLAQLAEIPLSTQDKTFLEDMNAFYLRSRYPDLLQPPLSDPMRKTATAYLEKTKQFLLWLQKQ